MHPISTPPPSQLLNSLQFMAQSSTHHRRCPSSTLVLLFLAFLSVPPAAAAAKIRHYRWEIKYEYKSPDCFTKLAVTINGETPGPTIDAQEGDTVVVEVTNSLLTENTAIHWHGIRQIGSPWSDGTEGVTQCPIVPGDIFVYKFVVDRPGTYLYHAHYGMQRSAGLNGLIRVRVADGVVEPFRYDRDTSMVLNDWWHKSTYEQATGIGSVPFVFVGEPQSLLINGRGRYNCSLAPPTTAAGAGVCNTTNPACSPYTLTVVPGKTYRLRIASITSLSALAFSIQNHNLTVVEADGHYVNPFTVTTLFLYSGETYSALFTADQDPTRNYYATVDVVTRKPATPTGLAIINYYPNHSSNRNPSPNPVPSPSLWNDTLSRVQQSKSIKSHPSHTIRPPATSDRTIVLLNTQNKIDGHVRWSVNNVSYNLPQTPYLIAMKRRLRGVFDQTPPPDGFEKSYDIHAVPENTNATPGNSVYRLGFNTTVDVVLQNANTMTANNSETHPWHLHGHDFWVLGYGEGRFDREIDGKSYNLVDPALKNTVPLHPYGWTAIRFRADNPGVWAFHCHIEAHFAMGMGVVFEEGVERVGRLPKRIMGCGASKGLRA